MRALHHQTPLLVERGRPLKEEPLTAEQKLADAIELARLLAPDSDLYKRLLRKRVQ